MSKLATITALLLATTLYAKTETFTVTPYQQEVLTGPAQGRCIRWAGATGTNPEAFRNGEIRAEMFSVGLYPCTDWNMPDPSYYWWWYGKGEYWSCITKFETLAMLAQNWRDQ